MRWRAPNHGVAGRLAVVDVEPMDDDIGDELNGDTSPIGNVDIDTTAIDGLKAVHDQLLLQFDDHVTLEHNPQRLLLDDGVAESPRLRVDGVVITGVSDHVEAAVAATDGVPAEANAAVREALSVLVPVGVTAPAVIDRVTGPT